MTKVFVEQPLASPGSSNKIFKKVYLLLKPIWHFLLFLFHSHDPKPKQNHQISSSRGKTRPTRSQACVKYRGNKICIKRNTDVNTGYLKNTSQKMFKYGWFSRRYLYFLLFAFNLIFDWRTMAVTVHLAPWS